MGRTTHLKTALVFWGIIIAACPIAKAQFGGGTGEPSDPYLIYTPEQMNAIGANPDYWGKHFKLMADLDLSAYIGEEFNIIGIDYKGAFSGVFDGNAHTISNFTYETETVGNIGLFGAVSGPGATIKNLGLINPTTGCPSQTTSDGCYSLGSLVGYLQEGEVVNCCVQGGCVVGNGDMAGEDKTARARRPLLRPYSSHCLGGLIGQCSIGSVINCYSTAAVYATDRRQAGGLIGSTVGPVINCYAAGTVTGDYYSVGGLVGKSRGDVENCFWDIEVSGQSDSGGGTGLTTAEMQDPNVFIAAGWDFFGFGDGPSDVWAVDPNTGYPMLWWQVAETEEPGLARFAGGLGTQDDPYLISSAEQFNGIGHNPRFMSSCFKLVADIDLGDVEFGPIGNELFPFSGVFDGDGRAVSGLAYVAEDEDHVGLFRYVRGPSARISNVGLIDPNIVARNSVGALIGYLNEGTLNQCYVTGGTVDGDTCVGGLVGHSVSGTISDSRTAVIVSGSKYTGGILGFNGSGTVARCYSEADVTNSGYHAGGLVGCNDDGLMTDCYSTSIVRGSNTAGGLLGRFSGGAVVNCYSIGHVTGEYDDSTGGLIGYGLGGPLVPLSGISKLAG